MADDLVCRVEGCVNVADVHDMQFCTPHLGALMSTIGPVKVAVPVCTVAACEQPPRSTFSPYCHMHDGRVRRHGNIDRKPMVEVLNHSHGYRLILAKGHPMARGARAFEHRVVYHDAHPEGPDPCHWCGKDLTWATLQVDHLNAVRDDNRLANLVAACGDCNRDRAKPSVVRAHKARAKKYMVNGRWWSIDEAAAHIGVNRSSIIARIDAGWSIDKALTEPRGVTGPRSSTA